MKKHFRILCIVILFLAFTQHIAAQKSYPIQELHCVAHALNIEGGTIAHKYLRSDQIWANLCVVLDRPFEDGAEWDEITQSNCFPLKESSIASYNEAHVNLAYALILHYYVTQAHKIMSKATHEEVTLLIQVHRNTSGPKHVELLERLLCESYPELKKIRQAPDSSFSQELFTYYFPEINVRAHFCYGTDPIIFKKAKSMKKLILFFHIVWSQD